IRGPSAEHVQLRSLRSHQLVRRALRHRTARVEPYEGCGVADEARRVAVAARLPQQQRLVHVVEVGVQRQAAPLAGDPGEEGEGVREAGAPVRLRLTPDVPYVARV